MRALIVRRVWWYVSPVTREVSKSEKNINTLLIRARIIEELAKSNFDFFYFRVEFNI